MPKLTYIGDAPTHSNGYDFPPGVAVEIDRPEIFDLLKQNPFFTVGEVAPVVVAPVAVVEQPKPAPVVEPPKALDPVVAPVVEREPGPARPAQPAQMAKPQQWSSRKR